MPTSSATSTPPVIRCAGGKRRRATAARQATTASPPMPQVETVKYQIWPAVRVRVRPAASGSVRPSQR